MKHLITSLAFCSLFSIASLSFADDHLENEAKNSEPSASAQTVDLDSIKAKEGTQFTRLAEPLKVSTGEKVEVRELFWYGCPHCAALEPVVLGWLNDKPDNAEFVPMPAVFSQRWVFHAKAFYTLQALGIEETAHPKAFDAIHKHKQPINNLKQLNNFLEKNGYEFEEDKVEAAFNSFTVDSNMRAANAYSLKSGANGVPAIIVDGKFLASVSSAGGGVQLFQLVNELIDLAQSERES